MRSLRITLHTQRSIMLPLAYNELVQGMLYHCWREHYPSLHDSGTFRPFVFGRLQGKAKVDSKARTICFSDFVSLEVRTPIEELLDECATQLASNESVRLGAYTLRVANLQTNDRLLFPQRTNIELLAPAVAYHTLDEGHTVPYSPLDPEWLPLIQQNIARKAEELGVPFGGAFQAIPHEETLRKHVTRFKGTYITGWTGKLMVQTEPQVLAMLWCTGLGVKNSQGFGLFDVLDR